MLKLVSFFFAFFFFVSTVSMLALGWWAVTNDNIFWAVADFVWSVVCFWRFVVNLKLYLDEA